MKKPVKKEMPVVLSEKIFDSRKLLRDFCSTNSIPCPAYLAADNFANLSAWAVKHNSFPVSLKTDSNLSDGKLNFILKGFKELPEFYEKIAAENSGFSIIEEFINSKAKIEACCVKGEIKLIAQVSLDKSVFLRHSWRAFPIKLPNSILLSVKNIINSFMPVISDIEEPIRFGFALSKSGPALVSINKGGERPEYTSEWCFSAGISDILSSKGIVSSEVVCKVIYARNYDKDNFNPELLKSLCGKCYKAHKIVNDDILVLCSSKDTKELQSVSLLGL